MTRLFNTLFENICSDYLFFSVKRFGTNNTFGDNWFQQTHAILVHEAFTKFNPKKCGWHTWLTRYIGWQWKLKIGNELDKAIEGADDIDIYSAYSNNNPFKGLDFALYAEASMTIEDAIAIHPKAHKLRQGLPDWSLSNILLERLIEGTPTASLLKEFRTHKEFDAVMWREWKRVVTKTRND